MRDRTAAGSTDLKRDKRIGRIRERKVGVDEAGTRNCVYQLLHTLLTDQRSDPGKAALELAKR